MAETRRRVLAGAGAIGLAAAVKATGVGGSRSTIPARVAVVGAGLAGLQAAQTLVAAGCSAQVLESRNRIGGRVHTSRVWPDLPVDLGASWIHGDKGNPLTQLAFAAGAATHPTSYARSRTYIGNSAQLLGIRQGDDSVMARAKSAMTRITERSDRDLSRAEAARRAAGDPRSAALLGFDVESNYVLEFGAPASNLSAWYGDTESWPGSDVLLPNGFDQLVRNLAQGVMVRLGQEVTTVRQDAAGVVLTTRSGAAERFDAVIVTVPLALLQAGRIAFDPPLPAAKRDAIGRLGMGVLDKLWLRFDRIVWPTEPDWFEHVAVPAADWAQWVSLAPYRRTPVLLGFAGAQEAVRLEGLSQAAVVESAMAALRDMFGSRFPAPIAVQWTRWHADPWTLGSYSYAAVGSTPADRTVLAAPVGRIAFAGEACHRDQWGTAHGAMISGSAAATRLLKFLGAKPI